MKAAQQGNLAAFTDLVESHKNLVHSLAYAITGSVSQSDEAVQETFVAVWKRLSETDSERFRLWLCGIARLVSLNLRRDDRRRFLRYAPLPSPLEVEIPSTEPSPLERAISHEEERLLWRALERLPEIYRVPLVLFYREQRSIEMVAEALGLRQTVVKMRLFLGRRMLNKQESAVAESALTRIRTRKKTTAIVLVATSAGSATIADASISISNDRRRPRALEVRSVVLNVAAAVTIIGLGALNYGVRHSRPDEIAARTSVSTRFASVAPKWTAEVSRTQGIEDQSSMVGPPRATTHTVLQFDFEDGLLPPLFSNGQPVAGPARRDNRYCLIGTLLSSDWVTTFITLGPAENRSPIFAYSKGQSISFDYWLARSVPDITFSVCVEAYDDDKKCNFQDCFEVPASAKATWMHGEISLGGLQRTRQCPSPSPMVEGDRIQALKIFSGRLGNVPFYVDNIRIVDFADEITRPANEATEDHR